MTWRGKTPILRSLGFLLTLALIAAACGDSDDSADEATTQAPATTEAPAPAEDPEPAETPATTEAPAPAEDPEPAETPATTEAPAPAEVSVRLDFFTVGGYHSPFHVAVENGYYAEENLTVTINEGQGSASTAQLVAAGEDTFGLSTGNIVVSSLSEGLPIKSVAQWLINTGFCVISLDGSGIESVDDMVGRRLANPPFGASGPLLPAFFAKYGITYPGDIEEVTIDPSAATPALLEGATDLWVSTNFGFPVQFEAEFGRATNCFPFKDVGVDPVGWALHSNTSFIAENPGVVERFVRATMRGWKWTLANPVEAGQITRDRVPTATNDPETAAAHLAALTASGLDPAPRDGRTAWGQHPIEEWENTINLMVDFLGLENPPALEDLFTDEFVPTDLP